MPTAQDATEAWANPTEHRAYRALARLGIEFIPQYAIGRYRADAFLPKHKVVIEFDGDDHMGTAHRISDEARDLTLAKYGYYTLRITYRVMRRDTLTAIKKALENIGIPSSPHLGRCTHSIDEIVTIEARLRVYLSGYVEAAGMLIPVFNKRNF